MNLIHLSLIFILFFILSSISCMHVMTLDGIPETTASREIPIDFNRLSYTGGADYEDFASIIESENYYITVGNSSSDLSGLTGGSGNSGSWDFVIAKFNKSDLSLVSINNLGGTSGDSFKSLIASDDYYIAVGNSSSDLSGLTGGANTTGNYDFVIAKFNKSDLSLVTLNNLGGTATDFFESIIESDNYYIASGSSTSDLSSLTGGTTSQGSYDFVIAKFNKSDLSLATIKQIGEAGEDRLYSFMESDNYYITVGTSSSDLSSLTGGTACQGGIDFVIAKFNKSDLSLVTINNLGGSTSDYFYSITGTDGYYAAVGYSYSDLSSLTGGTASQGGADFVIAKFNADDLSLVTLNNIGGTNGDYFEEVIESCSHYIAVGRSNSDLSSLNGGTNTQGDTDFVIVKFNKADLSLNKINNIGGADSESFYSIIESDNHYIAAGYSESDLSGLTGGSNTQGNNDFAIIKFGD